MSIDLGHLSRLTCYRELLAQQRDFDRQRAKVASVRARVKWAEVKPLQPIFVAWSANVLLTDSFILLTPLLGLPVLLLLP